MSSQQRATGSDDPLNRRAGYVFNGLAGHLLGRIYCVIGTCAKRIPPRFASSASEAFIVMLFMRVVS
ncbi:hypothetical protein [Atlantibacter sp.]|uniref:hypothetical protein n=1 Tax=Atlantibacter sp. TaxID=1903473 RepID=UPI0013EFBA28|nr:hypothetical protein [Atlantibacter sp.]